MEEMITVPITMIRKLLASVDELYLLVISDESRLEVWSDECDEVEKSVSLVREYTGIDR